MSFAFEVTAEDVAIVMDNAGQPVDEETAEQLFDEHILGEDARIEKAALRGNEMEQQTEYAHSEIAAILREAGVLN